MTDQTDRSLQPPNFRVLRWEVLKRQSDRRAPNATHPHYQKWVEQMAGERLEVELRSLKIRVQVLEWAMGRTMRGVPAARVVLEEFR